MNDLFAKKSSRLTAVLLAALLLCMPLSSCGSQGGGTTEPTGETAAPTDGSSPAEETTATTAATTLPTQKDVSGEQTQTLGAVLVVGDTGYEYYNFVRSVADQYATLVSRLGTRLQGVSTVYDMVVPTSIDITLQDSVRAGLSTSDQGQAIEYLYGSMINVTPVNLYDTLKSHRDEYLYFRTDHHWTALGAYYGYEQFAKAKGVGAGIAGQIYHKGIPGFSGRFLQRYGKKSRFGPEPRHRSGL